MVDENILVVDDDKSITDLLHALLHEEGYRTSIAGDGETALDKLNTAAFDAVLLDLTLPGIDGLEVCRQIRRLSVVPVIIITGRSGDDIESKCLEVGADDYIQKPFTSSLLASHIKAVLRRTMPRMTSSPKIAVNLAARTVTVAGRPVELTRKEFDILSEWRLMGIMSFLTMIYC